MNSEYRFLEAKACGEIRLDPGADGKPPVLRGYAAVFNSPSEDLGGFREIIAPGAFRDALASGDDIRALVGHDPMMLLGRTSNKTLRLREDDKGLYFENDVPDTSYARDMTALVNRGDIRGMSFGFRIVAKGDDSIARTGNQLIRTVHKAKLGEVSVVGNPAYRDTNLSLRVDPACLKRVEEMNATASIPARRKQLRHMQLLSA